VKLEHVPPHLDVDADALKAAVKPATDTTTGGTMPGGPSSPGGPPAPGAPAGPGAPGAPGGAAPPPPPPDVIVPKDPDSDLRAKEDAARRANPDEDDAADE
jgi:hypothetical protein